MSEKLKLVLHIGAGKTGTSSIQKSLKNSKKILDHHKIAYWGLMLESAPFKKYEWQRPASTRDFLKKPIEEIESEIFEVIKESAKEATKNGYKIVVWSNEFFFKRPERILPAVVKLDAAGVDLQIVLYLRRYDEWAKSAYTQWGLKHKVYNGKVLSFKDYYLKRPIRFFGLIQSWLKKFPNKVIIKNFDTSGDVVESFANLIGLNQGEMENVRTNETPAPEELYIRTIFNNFFKRQVRPVEFDRLMNINRIDFQNSQVDWMKSLLPTNEDLAVVISDSLEDQQKVNQILVDHNEPLLDTTENHIKPFEIDNDKLVSILTQITINQSIKIDALENEINSIKDKLNYSNKLN